LIHVGDVSNAKNFDIEAVFQNDFPNELRWYAQAVQYQCLDILKQVLTVELREDASQRAGEEVILC
jgi:hypothetical protein